MKEKLTTYANFVKFEHTLFSLPLIFAGALLGAGGIPSSGLIVLIILAGTGARTAALGLNRIIDRRIDSSNPRTESRELPSGKIDIASAFAVTGAGAVLYFISAYLICDLVFYLSPIPLLVFIIYPYMKRFTPLCHFGVGVGLALAPLGGWVAVTCSFDRILPALLLSFFTLFWVSGFDIIYATLDEEFDRGEGIFSIVSVYGRRTALLVSSAAHVTAFLFLSALYIYEFDSLVAVVFLLLTGALLFLEQRKSSDVNFAFFHINVLVGLVIFFFVASGIYLT